MGKKGEGVVGNSESRVQAIDFTKGALVVFMVVYHSLNYSTQYHLGFKYLAFLPPSFIFITGFLIASVYFRRPLERDGTTRRRMLVRGLKLLAIFTALNIAVTLVSTRYYNGQPLNLSLFFSLWREVYLQGAGSLVAFEVLVPIAYILLIGPVLLGFHRMTPWIVPVLAIIVIVGLVWLQAIGQRVSANVSMMAAGFVGAGFGIIPKKAFNALSRFWYTPIAVYAVIGFVGNRYGVVGQWILAQQVAAVVAVAALYGIGARFRTPEWLIERIVVLGNYSLLAYIAQIGFLQILVRWTGRFEPGSLAFAAFLLSVLILTSLAAEITHWSRERSGTVDGAYRFVFG